MHPKNGRLHIQKSIIVIYNLKDQSPMNISIDAKRTFDKIPAAFMIETLSKLGIERNFPTCWGSVCETHSSRGRLNTFCPDVWKESRRCPFSPLLFNSLLEALVKGSWARKGNM